MGIVRRQEEPSALGYGKGLVIKAQLSRALCAVKYLMPQISLRASYLPLIFAAAYSRKIKGKLLYLCKCRVYALVYCHNAVPFDKNI